MKKRIGVFLGEVQAEFQRRVLQAVYNRANALGYHVFVFSVYGAYGNNILYAEGERAMVYLPDVSLFDGIIVASDTFNLMGMNEELAARLKKEAKCPVVYVRSETNDFYNVLLSDVMSMKAMVKHFIEKHGFRDICFMQGKMSMQDARNRYQGYTEAMQEAGIPITEHMVFEGDYWRNKGARALDWFMEGRETYPQAIVCANDFMALSVCEELKRRNIRVPEDICVSGMDDVSEAQHFQPSISSIQPSYEQMAEKAVEIIDRVNQGLEQERVEIIVPELALRKSCGCGGQVVVDDWFSLQQKIYRQESDLQSITLMISECQDLYSEEECLRIAEHFFSSTRAKRAYFCMCKDEESEEEFPKESAYNLYANKVVLNRVLYSDKETLICGEEFERKYLLPLHILEQEEAQNFLVFGIHYKTKCFGYVVMVFDQDTWIGAYTQPYLMCIAHVMDMAYMNKEISGLEHIRELYQQDPLTGIYNRRGFEKQLRMLYSQKTHKEKYVSIVSVDMDGLKFINDEYGHAEGDDALCRLARVLERVILPGEMCARVGGDEFSVILVAEDKERHQQFAQLFTEEMKKEELSVEKPYPFHASVGLCCITEEGAPLLECLQKADKEMYINKRKNKLARKWNNLQ